MAVLASESRQECYRCFKPQVTCICASIAPVANETELLILQHPKERFHSLGTVRIARLGFTRIHIEPCAPWRPTPPRHAVPPRSALLFPSPEACELSALPLDERPRHLVVLDGTWFHAKKIYDAHRWLHALPHVRLTPTEPSRYRLRREPDVNYVATLEAIVYALRIIEPHTPGLDGLLQSFATMIDRQSKYARGGFPKWQNAKRIERLTP